MFQRIIETSAYVQSFAVRERVYLLSDRRVQVFTGGSHEKVAETELFAKDGLARSLIMDACYIYCSDFIHLYILDKGSLQVLAQLQLGTDLSSDICSMTQDQDCVYAGIRNGAIARIEKGAWQHVEYHAISRSSMWTMEHEGARIYAGNVDGELLVIDTGTMAVEKRVPAHKGNLKSLCLWGDVVVTAAQDKSLALWDRHMWERIQVKRNAHKKAFAIIGPWDGHLLTVSYPCGEIKVWDGSTLQERKVIPIAPCLSGQTCLRDAQLYLSSRAIRGMDRADIAMIVT